MTEVTESDASSDEFSISFKPWADVFYDQMKFKFRPSVGAQGHVVTGRFYVKPSSVMINTMGCEESFYWLGSIEACFDRDLNSVYGTVTMQKSLDSKTCAVIPYDETIMFEPKSILAYRKPALTKIPDELISRPFATASALELYSAIKGDLHGRVIDSVMSDNTTPNNEDRALYIALLAAKERFEFLPPPENETIANITELGKTELDTLIARLKQDVYASTDPPELIELRRSPIHCQLETEDLPCTTADRDKRLVRYLADYQRALSDLSKERPDIPRRAYFQVTDSSTIDEIIANRGFDRFGVRTTSPEAGFRSLIREGRKFNAIGWCDDKALARLHLHVKQLIRETQPHFEYLSNRLDDAVDGAARKKEALETVMDTWTEWSVFTEVTGLEFTVNPTGLTEAMVMLFDMGQELTGSPEDASTKSVQNMAAFVDWVLAVGENYSTPVANRAASSVSVLGWYKSFSDIAFGGLDLLNIAMARGWMSEEINDGSGIMDALPMWWHFAERLAYIEPTQRRTGTLLYTLMQLDGLLTNEIAWRD
ncbi:hypothetical protein [Tateyamaria sp.]|uniref:hypothetical protein n=1 Tax=Tateyamaria sp. TaxID=1929288 RepID=UPI00329C794D